MGWPTDVTAENYERQKRFISNFYEEQRKSFIIKMKQGKFRTQEMRACSSNIDHGTGENRILKVSQSKFMNQTNSHIPIKSFAQPWYTHVIWIKVFFLGFFSVLFICKFWGKFSMGQRYICSSPNHISFRNWADLKERVNRCHSLKKRPIIWMMFQPCSKLKSVALWLIIQILTNKYAHMHENWVTNDLFSRRLENSPK